MSLVLAFVVGATLGASAPERRAGSDISVRDTREVLERYGQCVVKIDRRGASEAILSDVGNKEFRTRYRKLIDGDCLVNAAGGIGAGTIIRAKFAGDQFRYALADALFRVELAGLPARIFDGVPKLDHRHPGEPPAKVNRKGKPLRASDYEARLRDYDVQVAANYLSQYGECVARLNPVASRALLLTHAETRQETAAFESLRGTFAQCLPEAVTLTFSKVTLRGTLAVNYYRLAKAAAGIGKAAVK